MTRLNLRQLAFFFRTQNLNATANYFEGRANDSVTVDGWIESGFVSRHVCEASGMWREIQANVTMSIEMDA